MSDKKPYDEGIRVLRERLDEPVDAQLLDDVQRRVRVAIADKQRGGSPRLVFGLIATMALAFAGGAVVVLRRQAPSRPVSVAARDSVRLELDGTTTALDQRSVIVRDGVHAYVTLPEGARIDVSGPAKVTTHEGHFALDSGSALVSVEKQAPGASVVMRLGEATIIVHGTRFVMVADEGQSQRVEVSEGIVEVRAADQSSTMLHAGQVWSREARRTVEAPLAKTVEPEPTAPRKAPAKKAKVDLRAAAEKAMARRDCDETRVLVARYLEDLDDAAEAARAAMLEAECWLRANDKARALPVLDRIAKDYQGQPGAQSALFEAATARADLKQSIDAIAGFDAYLQRYPKGTFAESAAFRRCELLNQQSGHKVASSCLGDFVERFPKGRRAGDALLLAGSLDCADERYSDATKAFWAYTEHMPPERDDMGNLESLVRCLERGKATDAARAREAFVKRHPPR